MYVEPFNLWYTGRSRACVLPKITRINIGISFFDNETRDGQTMKYVIQIIIYHTLYFYQIRRNEKVLFWVPVSPEFMLL